MQMRHWLFVSFFLISFTGASQLSAQKVVEIYLSSNDCVKCISGISNIVGLFEKHKFPKPALRIITDFKSNKKRVLNEFEYLEDSLVVYDKDVIATMLPESRSKYLIRQGNEILETKYISDIKSEDLVKMEALFKTIDFETVLHIPDTIFEKGNFTAYIGNKNIVLFQKASQTYLIIPFHEGSMKPFYHKVSESRQSYTELMRSISSTNKINLLDYDSSLVLNQKIKLPLSNIASYFLNGDTLFQYKNVYFYQSKDGGSIANRGFVFLEKQLIGKEEIKSFGNYAINPFIKGKDTWAPFLFYPHQHIGEGRYFTYYNLLSGDTNGKKLDHTYFGGVYSIGQSGTESLKDFKFGITGLPDSVQETIRKFSYGNNPKYFSFKGGDYVLYKNFAQVLDLKSGRLIALHDFIWENFHVKADQNEFFFIWDIYCADDVMNIVYYHETKPGLLLARYQPDQLAEIRNVNFTGDPGAVSIDDKKLIALRKLDDEGILEIKLYPVQ